MLCHKDVGFPRGVNWPVGRFPLRYSSHALVEARRDRLGDARPHLPAYLDTTSLEVVEAEFDSRRRVHTMVCRTKLDQGLDLVLVVLTARTVWFVKTVYLNRKSDSHATLRRERYFCPLEN